MIKRLSLVLVAAGLAGAVLAGGDNAPTPIRTVMETARRKDKVLIAGKIKRARTLDIFLFGDDTGELLINAAHVKTSMAVGDDLVVWGRFWGRSDNQPDLREIEVIDAAPAGSREAALLISAHAAAPPPPPEPAIVPPNPSSPAAAPARSTESRLQELEQLKAKGLITDSEYQEQRKRILGDL